MLLKTLSLAGFKSFADRTRLEFHSGVNVVVGPNGSGKSNLLDALAWVMGTQAVTALRTQKMDDVIFAGTATRPPLGRAEVTVTFDNADRFLPLDLDEISMTRRLYRDGTSEYLLNGTQCRLLDLHEILADGGVGRHQHVLVGQGQIGDILSASPQEHRAVIEEAAGVTKHRGRRDRSVRRLAQTDEDMARLGDILEEQRRRLRPLKRQANAAERYDSVRDEARALRLWLGGETLRRLAGRERAASAERNELDERLRADALALDELVAGLDGIRAAAGRVGRDLERDTAAAARLETLIERLQRIGSIGRERRRALQSSIEGAGERRADLEAEAVELREAIADLAGSESEARTRLEALEASHAALEDEERALAEQVGLSAEGLVANLRGDVRALEAAAERDAREHEGLEMRRAIVVKQLEADETERVTLVAAIEATDASVGTAQEAYEEARRTRAAAQARWDEASARKQSAVLAFETARARREAIATALAGEGDPEARTRARGSDEIVGSVVDRLDVPGEAAAAVDGALGEWRDALVAADRDGVRRVAELLKSDGLGGVAVLASAGDAPEPSATKVAAEWGGDALVDLLGPAADRSLAVALLGDVVLVEGWSNGWELVRRHPHLRAVTPEGDVVSATGMYLAQPDGVGPAALEAAAVDLERADTAARRAESGAVTAQRAFTAARERERTSLEALESLEARLAGHTEALALIDRVRSEHIAEMERLELRGDTLAEQMRAREDRLGALRRQLGELDEREEGRQRAWDELRSRRTEVAERRRRIKRERDESADTLARALERRGLLERRLESVTDDLSRMGALHVDDGVIEGLEAVETGARRGVEACRRHLGALRDRQRLLREQATVADARLEEALEGRDDLRRRIDEAKERSSALAIELAEVEIRSEATAEALRRDADATEEEALAAPAPPLEEGASPAEVLASLEARVRRMGPVNPLAAQEYRALAEEVEVLETQLADLTETARELRKVISALDDEMASLFIEAFDDIAVKYEENFALVFPGGRGRLVLTDPGNLLETGVEIHAQPLGKKVGRLSLLSGGERSLAALAFLFAVFRARPSPFYVLDEVEAALDDANLRRFIRLVETLRRSAQLVIITHQQQTMGAADILYGVTMEPGESSLIVAKRLADAVA